MRKYKYYFILNILFLLILSENGNSIPVFAKKYKTTCLTCHVSFAKRNSFGEAFRRNGYAMPHQAQSMIKEPPLKLGADQWKEIWPDGIWPSSIPSNLPIAMYGAMQAQYTPQQQKKTNYMVNFPADLGLLFAGNFGDNISFFGAWSTMYGVNRISLKFNNLVGLGNALNLRIGKFDLGINDSYQVNQKITIANPITHSFTPCGLWNPKNYPAGLEFNGIINHNYNYQVGLVNSIRSDGVEAFDYFDTYARIGYKIGGISLDGEINSEDSTAQSSSEHNAVLVSAFGYFGNSLKSDFKNRKFQRFGGDIKYNYGDFELFLGGWYGWDANQDTILKDMKSIAAFSEIDYNIYPWLLGVLRIEYGKSFYNDYENEYFTNIIPNLTILIRQNLRLAIEGNINYQFDKKQNSVTVIGNNYNNFKSLKTMLVLVF